MYDSTDRQNKKKLKEIYKEFRLNEYSLHADIKDTQNHFKENTDPFTAQKIATRVCKAIEDLLFGNDEFNSLEGKSNETGIRFKEDSLIWNGLKIPVKVDYDNTYEFQAMQDEICYLRIKCKFIRDKYKYYLRLVLKGFPPPKINRDGKLKRNIGKGTLELDIGTQTLAIASDSQVKLLELADRVQDIEDEKRRLL